MSAKKYLYTFKVPALRVDAGYQGNIVLPMDVAEAFKAQDQQRVLIRINGHLEKFGAINSRGDGSYFLYVNKSERKLLSRDHPGQLTVEIGPDLSHYGMPMPTELKEAFHLYPNAEKLFKGLTPGRQRSIIYTVAKPRREETRIRKAIIIMDYLIDYQGVVDLREMSQYIKDYREKI